MALLHGSHLKSCDETYHKKGSNALGSILLRFHYSGSAPCMVSANNAICATNDSPCSRDNFDGQKIYKVLLLALTR